MTARGNMSIRFCYAMVHIGAWIGALNVNQAIGQGKFRPASPESIFFEDLKPPELKRNVYGHGQFVAQSGRDGWCSISGSFLASRLGSWLTTGITLRKGDVIALLGSVYRANAQDSLVRIPSDELPKGIEAPAWDSVTVPYSGKSSFRSISIEIQEFEAQADKGHSAALKITIMYVSAGEIKPPAIVVATVKAGDIILLRDYGHVVRAVVPPNINTRVVGWIELAPEPIPEADLIRDKRTFVRPMPKAGEKK